MFVRGAREAPSPVASTHLRRIAELLDSFGDGFLVLDADWRVLDGNTEAAEYLGTEPNALIGRNVGELAPGAVGGDLVRALTRVMTERCTLQGEAESEAHPGRWVAFRAFPAEGGVAVGFRDISEQRDRRRRNREQSEHLSKALARVEELESRRTFLLQLTDTLRPLEKPEAILSVAARMLGERYAASRAGYAEATADGEGLTVGGNWTRAGVESHTHRTFPRAVFGAKAFEELQSGKTVHVDDVVTDPRTKERCATYEAMDVRAFISVPLLRDGKMDASFSVMTPDARHWTEDDIRLVEEVAARTWATQQRARMRTALRESEARFRSVADCAPNPVWVTSAAGEVEFVNRAYSQSLAERPEKLLGKAWMNLLHPDDRDRVIARRDQARAAREVYTFEARMLHPKGEYRIMRVSSRPRLDDNGVFQGYVGMSFDVTDVRQAEERQNVLIKELNHRVKNTLATVQSIIHQVLRKDPIHAETRLRITDRLVALSSAHDVLTRQNWQYADLMDVIREATRPYTDAQAPRIELMGPPARLAPGVAVAMAMALNELGANAVRHGALSAPSGHVRIGWRCGADGLLELEWREHGGPRIGGPPSETGLGSRLLQGLIAEFGKAAELDFTPTGLVCRLAAPTLKD